MLIADEGVDVDYESERTQEGGIAFSIAAAGEVFPNAKKLETELIDQRTGESRCRNLSERTPKREHHDSVGSSCPKAGDPLVD
jgi:hypothetical protein